MWNAGTLNLSETGMDETRPRHRTLRRIGAVLAGLVAIIVLSVSTDAVLHASGVFPPWGEPMADALFLLATAYRTIYGVAGSYIAARLSPDRPVQHALALGLVGLVLSTVGAVATWGRGPEFGPAWYPVALIVLAMPCAWAGGKLQGMQLRARADGRRSGSLGAGIRNAIEPQKV
jgi:hypothetical protein